MIAENRIINLSFSLEPGLSDSEIEKLWQDCQQAQLALDKFLSGEMTEQEMTDVLSYCEIDPDETRETMEHNAGLLGLTTI
jgi:hypothetical protein